MRLLFAFIAAVLTASVHAQVTETVEVRLIEVDATVTDRDGVPVTGLTAADFELFENGRPQAITNFSEYRQTSSTSTATATAAPAPSPAIAVPAPRTLILFIDSNIPARGEARAKLFANLRDLATKTMREGDRAQVLVWHDRAGVISTSALTTDRTAILKAIGDAERNLFVDARGPTIDEYARFYREAAEIAGGSPEGDIRNATRGAAGEELAMMQRKTAAMERIVSSLARSRGRSAFVYAAEAFPLVAGMRAHGRQIAAENIEHRGGFETRKLLDAVIRAANASGVTFYALRADFPDLEGTTTLEEERAAGERRIFLNIPLAEQLLMQNELSALNLVAEQTGGAIGFGPAGTAKLIERIDRELGSYYTLAYRARTDGSDRERRIEVRPKNAHHVVRTRRSVVEKSDRTLARDLVVARLFERGPAGDIDFDVKVLQPIDEKKHVRFPVELKIPSEQLQFEEVNGELVASFSVVAVSAASLQTTGEVTEDTRRVVLPIGTKPGGDLTYTFSVMHDRKPATLSIVVLDDRTGLAGTRQVRLEGGTATVAPLAADPAAAKAMSDALARAAQAQTVLVVFQRGRRCGGCASFERDAIAHPTIQRRLANLVFITQAASETAIVLYDRAGTPRAKWKGLPEHAIAFGRVLDAIVATAPGFERAVALNEAAGPVEGELEAALAMARLGFGAEARAAIAKARAEGSPKTRQFAVITGAMLDASEGKRAEAQAALERLIDDAKDVTVAANAWMGIGAIHRGAGAMEPAIEAYRTASRVAGEDTDVGVAARQVIDSMQSAMKAAGPIRLVPLGEQIVTGRNTVRTSIASTEVARVTFTIDGGDVRVVDKPPFAASYDFGRMPQTRTIRAVAYDRNGGELGRDELTVNPAGETFWLRLTEPAASAASGRVRVSTTMRVPAAHRVNRVVISWNDTVREVLKSAPWQAQIDLPSSVGVLRAVAELDDGRSSEDAVLVNASGHVERAAVQLVELPIIAAGGTPKPADVVVREGTTRRTVETVLTGAD
ncbi:MAG TPA: VWA domain-containing protein, partial [Thermoanaerobaculia bacterium]|nr:VWA domain-containing protein [Thermoanaerobaculia bacterium]